MLQRHPQGQNAMSAREQADAFAELYIPVSPDGGRLLYTLIRASRPAGCRRFAGLGLADVGLV